MSSQRSRHRQSIHSVPSSSSSSSSSSSWEFSSGRRVLPTIILIVVTLLMTSSTMMMTGHENVFHNSNIKKKNHDDKQNLFFFLPKILHVNGFQFHHHYHPSVTVNSVGGKIGKKLNNHHRQLERRTPFQYCDSFKSVSLYSYNNNHMVPLKSDHDEDVIASRVVDTSHTKNVMLDKKTTPNHQSLLSYDGIIKKDSIFAERTTSSLSSSPPTRTTATATTTSLTLFRPNNAATNIKNNRLYSKNKMKKMIRTAIRNNSMRKERESKSTERLALYALGVTSILLWVPILHRIFSWDRVGPWLAATAAGEAFYPPTGVDLDRIGSMANPMGEACGFVLAYFVLSWLREWRKKTTSATTSTTNSLAAMSYDPTGTTLLIGNDDDDKGGKRHRKDVIKHQLRDADYSTRGVIKSLWLGLFGFSTIGLLALPTQLNIHHGGGGGGILSTYESPTSKIFYLLTIAAMTIARVSTVIAASRGWWQEVHASSSSSSSSSSHSSSTTTATSAATDMGCTSNKERRKKIKTVLSVIRKEMKHGIRENWRTISYSRPITLLQPKDITMEHIIKEREQEEEERRLNKSVARQCQVDDGSTTKNKNVRSSNSNEKKKKNVMLKILSSIKDHIDGQYDEEQEIRRVKLMRKRRDLYYKQLMIHKRPTGFYRTLCLSFLVGFAFSSLIAGGSIFASGGTATRTSSSWVEIQSSLLPNASPVEAIKLTTGQAIMNTWYIMSREWSKMSRLFLMSSMVFALQRIIIRMVSMERLKRMRRQEEEEEEGSQSSSLSSSSMLYSTTEKIMTNINNKKEDKDGTLIVGNSMSTINNVDNNKKLTTITTTTRTTTITRTANMVPLKMPIDRMLKSFFVRTNIMLAGWAFVVAIGKKITKQGQPIFHTYFSEMAIVALILALKAIKSHKEMREFSKPALVGKLEVHQI